MDAVRWNGRRRATKLFLIAVIGCYPAGSAAQLAAPMEELVGALDRAVPEIMQEHDIPGGAMVLVDQGSMVMTRGWGLADVGEGTPVDPDRTVFRIGSVTKFLTALAVVQLDARGQLRLSDPVSRWLEAEPPVGGAWPEELRVEHLLSHSGGFDQTGRGRRASSKLSRPTLADFVQDEVVPLRVPGWVPTYDTYGITLAGRLIEVVSGRPFAEYMREEIFEALGMHDTWVETPAGKSRLLATGYGLTNGELVPAAYEWYVTLPASSVDATVSDMGRLLVALLENGDHGPGRVLGPGTVAKVRTRQRLSGGAVAPFTHGLWEASIGGTRVLHHGGLMQGFESDLYMFPELGVGYFLAYNRDRETGPPPGLREAVYDLVVEHLVGDDSGPSGKHASEPIAVGGLAGTYANTLGCFTCLAPGSGWGVSFVHLEADGPGRLRTEHSTWTAVNDSIFEDSRGRRARFIRSPHGVTYLIQGINAYARVDEALLRTALGPEWQQHRDSPLVTVHATGRPPQPPDR